MVSEMWKIDLSTKHAMQQNDNVPGKINERQPFAPSKTMVLPLQGLHFAEFLRL